MCARALPPAHPRLAIVHRRFPISCTQAPRRQRSGRLGKILCDLLQMRCARVQTYLPEDANLIVKPKATTAFQPVDKNRPTRAPARERLLQRREDGESSPSKLEWTAIVFALAIQQGAFVSVPLLLGGSSLRVAENPFNTAGVALSIALVGIASVSRFRQIAVLASRNLFATLFIFVVLLSVTWSVHPDLTIRRGMGYALTMLIVAYLVVRFELHDRMRALSWSFAVSAIGSLLFVATFPQYGIGHIGDLAGDWSGIFAHKNALGAVMAVAVFTELYMLVTDSGFSSSRLVMLFIYFVLVVLSNSATALLLSLFYLTGSGIFLLWKWERLVGVFAGMFSVLALAIILSVLFIDPGLVLGVVGKNVTLTGRTTLWNVVIELIQQRPVLGWGYRATWVPGDTATEIVFRAMGGWGVPHAHNGFLELALQLGLLGVGLIVLVIGNAVWRGLVCCRERILPLGWFSLIFVFGAVLYAQSESTLGQNQAIDWLVFNVLSFSCGVALSQQRGVDPSSRPA
jgi:exopolysaccharide production protein ExoQ